MKLDKSLSKERKQKQPKTVEHSFKKITPEKPKSAEKITVQIDDLPEISDDEKAIILLSVSKQNSRTNTDEILVTPKTRTKDLSSIKIVEPSHVRFLKRKESHSP